MNTLIQKFLYKLSQEGKSKNTLDCYSIDLTQFEEFVDGRGLDKELIREYEQYLLESNLADRTIARKISSVNQFLQYINLEYRMTPPTIKRTVPKKIKQTELDDLVDKISQTTPKGLRDLAIIALLLDGVEISSIASMEVGDINELELRDSTWKYLQRYIKLSRPLLLKGKESNFIFLNMNGGSISRQGVWKMIKKYADKAGMEISPNMLKIK